VKVFAPSKMVFMALMAICSHESACLTVPHSPSYNVPIRRPLLDVEPAYIVNLTLISSTMPVPVAAAKIPPRHPLNFRSSLPKPPGFVYS
jgi:hypothetical protein